MENKEIENYKRYSKITQTLAYFPGGNMLKFVVKLKRKTKEGDSRFFHNEFRYIDEAGEEQYTMSLNILSAGWQIGTFKNNVYISIDDLLVVKYHVNNMLNNWYLNTDKPIFKLSPNGKLMLSRGWNPIQIPFNDYQYISFAPIIINYENESTQGCRITINESSNYMDLTTRDLFKLFTFLLSDPSVFIEGSINYISSCPKGVELKKINLSELDNDDYEPKNFFTK